MIDCHDAWSELTAAWAAEGRGTVDANHELVVDARCAVDFAAGPPSTDLCSPPVLGGYLGAENQTVRIELVDATHFTWGYDNAAPLYRVEVATPWPAPPADVTVTLLTAPRDQAHWPRANQVVELLPWSAVLPNGEKLAELTGHLARVTGSYDPDLGTLVIDAGPSDATPFLAWTARSDAGDLAGPTPSYFLRVWDRGADTSSPPAIPFMPGVAVPLGDTGLTVTFSGSQFVAGDHWIVSVRPETPDAVVPWSIRTARAPHGVRRFVAPLAVLQWTAGVDGGLVPTILSDCRPTFLPLTRLRGCCTHTVGDGLHSHGQYTSIQAAIDHLPPSGGKVCILPGEYREPVAIVGRTQVTLEGCGARTRLLGSDDPRGSVILVQGSSDITIRSLTIAAELAVGVRLLDHAGPTPVGTNPDPDAEVAPDLPFGSPELPLRRIVLEDLAIATDGGAAILGWGGRFVTVRGCRFDARLPGSLANSPELGRTSTVSLHCDDVVIERNQLIAHPSALYVATPFGGIQVGGGAERWVIRDNLIRGGTGDGVTLGSWTWVPRSRLLDGSYLAELNLFLWVPPGTGFTINLGNCVEIPWFPLPIDDDPADPLVPVSRGALRDIAVVGNDIERMGRAGVGVARWFDLDVSDELIVTDALVVAGNRIRGCVQLPTAPLGQGQGLDWVAQAAIAVAAGEDLVVRDNLVEGCGRSHVDPVCAVFALTSDGVVVERNRLVDNAARVASGDPPRRGWRDAVTLTAAFAPLSGRELVIPDGAERPPRPAVAARVHGNLVVQPEGRGVLALALGPVVVTDNQLTSRGIATASDDVLTEFMAPDLPLPLLLDALGGCVALVVSVGETDEHSEQLTLYRNLRGPGGHGLAENLERFRRPERHPGGTIQFADNRCQLDLALRSASVLASVALVGGDDLACADNLIAVDEPRDFVHANAVCAGFTVRLTDNRLTERLAPDADDALSAVALAQAAVAVTGNVSTHCLVAIGPAPDLEVIDHNLVLADPGPNGCEGAVALARMLTDRLL